MPKGLVPIAPLRRGLFVLGGDGKMGKVKGWKGEKMASPFKDEKMEGWKEGKGERVKKWLRPLKVKRWKGGKMEDWKGAEQWTVWA